MAAEAGGGGRRWSEEFFFLESWCLGMPGICSQENGTPLNLMRGEDGVKGGNSSMKERVDDPKDESQELDDDNDGVRRPDGRKTRVECGGSSSLGRIWGWSLLYRLEDML